MHMDTIRNVVRRQCQHQFRQRNQAGPVGGQAYGQIIVYFHTDPTIILKFANKPCFRTKSGTDNVNLFVIQLLHNIERKTIARFG